VRHKWEISAQSGASGGKAVTALPNSGTIQETGYLKYDPRTDAPKLDFMASFAVTGVHYIWVRLKGADNDNSVHISLDDKVVTSAEKITAVAENSWTWANTNSSLARASVNIQSKGIHTINLRMREDGTSVDKIILTTNPNYLPDDTGPAESNVEGVTTVLPEKKVSTLHKNSFSIPFSVSRVKHGISLISKSSESQIISIFSAQGKLVGSYQFRFNTSQTIRLKNGMYFMIIRSPQGSTETGRLLLTPDAVSF
jgi:hypothetical protein